jgi:hypothetical protein
MQRADRVGVRRVGRTELQQGSITQHRLLLIDPGSGTVPKPGAGPSSGQVPQVTLDESCRR